MENAILQLDFDFGLKPVQALGKPSKKDQKNFVFDLLDVTKSPVIVFKSQWQNSIPKDLLEVITEARMISALKKEELATIPEVVAYLMPRTFESPLDHNWCNIYTWAGAEYMRTFKKSNKADEIAPNQLSDYETSMMNDLRKWIYRKRREALKQVR